MKTTAAVVNQYTIDALDRLPSGKMVPLIELNAAGEFDVDDLIATYPFSQFKPVFVW